MKRAAKGTSALLRSIALTLLQLVPKHAMATDISEAELKVKILLRTLAFDRSLRSRAHDRVTIAVVTSSGDGPEKSGEVREAFRALTSFTVAGLPVQVLEVRFESEGALVEEIQRRNVSALFVGQDMERYVDSLIRIGREHSVSTLTDRRENVEKGLAVGVTVTHGRPKLIVNLATARAEGMDLSSEVLRLADVVP
jgi:hypothetical protein